MSIEITFDPEEEIFTIAGEVFGDLDDDGALVVLLSVIGDVSAASLRRYLLRSTEAGDPIPIVHFTDMPALMFDVEYAVRGPVSLEFESQGWATLRVNFDCQDEEMKNEWKETWVEMEDILKVWGASRALKFESLRLNEIWFPTYMWEIEFRINYRSKTVGDLISQGLDAISLIETYLSGEMSARDVLHALRAGRASFLVGVNESATLEAKKSLNIVNDTGKFELCKDVSGMANSKTDGIIVVGAETKSNKDGDKIIAIRPFEASSIVRRVRSIIASGIYPPIEGLVVEKVSVGENHTQDILVIFVPCQPIELQPFLVAGALIDKKLRGAFVTIASRRDEDTYYESPAVLHSMLSVGRAVLRSDGKFNFNMPGRGDSK